jgi:hypothetical protein
MNRGFMEPPPAWAEKHAVFLERAVISWCEKVRDQTGLAIDTSRTKKLLAPRRVRSIWVSTITVENRRRSFMRRWRHRAGP